MAIYKCAKCGMKIEITTKKPSLTITLVHGVRKDSCFNCGRIINKKKDKIGEEV